MLYDPKWDRNSLIGLRDWLSRQNPEETYNWSKCSDCVVGRYLTAQGVGDLTESEWFAAYGQWVANIPGAYRAVPECFSNIAISGSTSYGKALDKLDAWLASGVS